MTLKNRAERGTSQVFPGKDPEELFLTSTNSVLPELSCLREAHPWEVAIHEACCSADTYCSDGRLACSDGRSFDERPYRSETGTGLYREHEKLCVSSPNLQLPAG